jgi:hypothetical protein
MNVKIIPNLFFEDTTSAVLDLDLNPNLPPSPSKPEARKREVEIKTRIKSKNAAQREAWSFLASP